MNNTIALFTPTTLISLASALTLDANHYARVGMRLTCADLLRMAQDLVLHIGSSSADSAYLTALRNRYISITHAI